MMLLINVVMAHWAEHSLLDRARALRCLKAMLLFLHEEDAPIYFTQIMSTINRAMATNAPQLHFVALSVLSDYVQTVLKRNVKLIGTNLSDIVVALFPVFEEPNGPKPNYHTQRSEGNHGESDPFSAQSIDKALQLLSSLVDGKVGKKLSLYFCEVPFLPSSPALDGVRSALRRLGVDFDDLAIVTQTTTQGTQDNQCTCRDSIGSVGSEGEGHRSRFSSSAQAALRKRLGILSKLLSHENKQVRIAVLRHLTDLLRANRGVFLRLVESEESVSLRFLTVVKDATVIHGNEDGNEDSKDRSSTIGKGGVTEIVQKLVSRCVIETDEDARIALATCLGEMGAIDPNRLGREVNSTSVEDSFDVSGFHGSWRLSQPPWKSQVIRYE